MSQSTNDIPAQKLSKADKKSAIMAELITGASAYDLGMKYNISPTLIGTWRREQRKQAEKIDVQELAAIQPEVLKAVVDEVRTKAENSSELETHDLEKIYKQLDKVENGVASVQMLEDGFHTTMMNMLVWANNKISDDMKVSEWTQLVNGVSNLHGSLFGKGSSTQINLMQQNNGGGASSAKLEKFKSGFRI